MLMISAGNFFECGYIIFCLKFENYSFLFLKILKQIKFDCLQVAIEIFFLKKKLNFNSLFYLFI